MIGQGLSGTVDLQTVRPLSFGKRTVAGNIRREKSGIGTDFTGNGDRYNVSYIDQYADRTIGLALGFARLKSSQLAHPEVKPMTPARRLYAERHDDQGKQRLQVVQR